MIYMAGGGCGPLLLFLFIVAAFPLLLLIEKSWNMIWPPLLILWNVLVISYLPWWIWIWFLWIPITIFYVAIRELILDGVRNPWDCYMMSHMGQYPEEYRDLSSRVLWEVRKMADILKNGK